MNVIKSSGNISKKDMFNMTEGGSSNKMSDAIGQTLDMAGWILYETEDSKGQTVTALAVIEKNGLISSTISETFIKQFNKILDFMDGEDFNLKVIGGTSKNGRQFVTCEIA